MRIPIIAVLTFATVVFLVTGFWDFVSDAILPNTTWGLYSQSFFENVLVEAHGAVLDLLVVGVILYWFEQRRTRRDQIGRLEEELADLRLYRAPDAPYRTLGTIRRLLALDNSKSLQISEMTLSHLELKDLNFSKCNMYATVFTDSRIKKVCFEKCSLDAAIFAGVIMEHTLLTESSLRRAKFQNAKLNGLNLTSCQIQNADFTSASLRSANFKGLDCKGVVFKNADLTSANFIGALNLDPTAIATARCIRGLKSVDPRISAIVAAHKGK